MATKGQNTKGTATLSGTLPQSSAPSQPLFPRLHVNEGGKGGPRAPPRNKMALYEHLTIPSHRFVPGTATLPNTPTPAQGSGYEGRYLFSSSFLSPTVAFSAVNMGCQVHSQSSAGVSYDSAMVDGNKEIQRVPGVIPNGSIGMLSSSVGVSSGCYLYANSNQTNPSGKKVRDEDDFRVPQYSNSRISSSSMIELHSFKKCQPTDSCSSNPGRASVVASNMSQHEAALPCSTWVDVQGECLHLSETEMQKTQDGTDGHRAECENVHAISKVQFQIKDHREQSKHLSDSGNVSHDYIGLEQPQSSSHITDVVTLGEHTIRGDCVIGKVDDINSMKSASTDSNAASEGLPLPAGNFGREESQQRFGFDDERRADEDGPRQRDDLYPVSSLKNTRESTDEFEDCSDGSAAELSVPSQPMQGSGSEDGSDSSMVDSEPFSKISPDDVIGAIGKQQFWKARKAILRQQRIFSVQVFELHRLIKVQQLMAMSPILLIEKSAYVNAPFGKTAGEKILSDYVPETKTERKINDGPHIIDQPSSNTGEPAVGQLAQPGVACHPGWFNHGAVQTMSSDQNIQMYVGACPVMPLMIPGGMSAWGFPHPALGTGQWLVPTASPSGDFMHKPFPGIFPPPAAFTSPTFGTPGSLGFPPVVAASQGSEHLLEFEPRHGLPMSNLQYGAGVCSVPVVAPNFVPAWYGLPFPMVDSMQRANVHGTPLGTAHNGATQDGVAPNPLESLSRPTQLGQPSVETFIPCSGIFSHQQQTNNTSSQSILQDGMRSSSHANQTSRELNAHPQGLYNVSIQERRICGEQIKEKRWELSEGSHSKEINNLVGVDSELQERGSADGSERTPKRVRERDMEMNIGEYKCKMTLEKDTLTLFPLIPSLGGRDKPFHPAGEQQSRVIRVVPCDAVSASESTAGILLSIQQERQSEVNKKNVSM